MASDQHLCFRWKDHMQHISKVLKNLQEDEIHCDISLVTDDGYVVKAHQAVLASTSSYFKEVLKTISTDQHPIIVLNGANYSQVASLLHYMYEGSIKVEHDILDSLLEVADNLGVKGLCHVRENTSIKNLLTTTSHSPNRLQYSSPSNENPTSKDTTQLFNADSNTDDIDLDVTPTNSRVDSGTCRLDLSPVHSTPCRYTTNLPFTDTRDLASCSSNSRSHHQSTFSDVEPDDQISGMDLTLAKSDTWSPRHVSSRKRKKMESPSLEESNLYSTSDPDWGRIDKIDDNSPKKKNSSGKLESDLGSEPSKNSPFLSKEKVNLSMENSTLEVQDVDTITNYCFDKQVLEKNSSNKDSSNKKQLEVFSSDGAITITVTSGFNSQNSQITPSSRRLSLSSTPISLRKARRRVHARRELDEKRRKWLAREKKALFGSSLAILSSVRSENVKTMTNTSERTLEVVSVTCDPPFPSEKGGELIDKENISEISTNPSTKENQEKNNWNQHNSSRIQDNERKVKFPVINPLSLFTLPPLKGKSKQTRITLTIEEKVKVIEAFLDGKSQRQIAHMYGIGKTQVSGIIKRREEILTTYRDSRLHGEKVTSKRQRRSEYASLNDHLIQWHRHMTVVAGVKITTAMLRAKALEIAPVLGYHDFKASNGWLATFKSNNNLKFSRGKKSHDYEGPECNEEQEESLFEDDNVPDQTEEPSRNLPTTSNLSMSNPADNSHISHTREAHPGAATLGQVNVLGNSGLLSTTLTKAPQMVSTAITSNLAATAYNLSRDHRDLTRSDGPSHLGELHHSSAINNAPPLNHAVARTAVDNNLAKPSDASLAYKSEDSLTYNYDPQSRMNDPTARGTEYNYTPYGFPGSYYGYHFLGQY